MRVNGKLSLAVGVSKRFLERDPIACDFARRLAYAECLEGLYGTLLAFENDATKMPAPPKAVERYRRIFSLYQYLMEDADQFAPSFHTQISYDEEKFSVTPDGKNPGPVSTETAASRLGNTYAAFCDLSMYRVVWGEVLRIVDEGLYRTNLPATMFAQVLLQVGPYKKKLPYAVSARRQVKDLIASRSYDTDTFARLAGLPQTSPVISNEDVEDQVNAIRRAMSWT